MKILNLSGSSQGKQSIGPEPQGFSNIEETSPRSVLSGSLSFISILQSASNSAFQPVLISDEEAFLFPREGCYPNRTPVRLFERESSKRI